MPLNHNIQVTNWLTEISINSKQKGQQASISDELYSIIWTQLLMIQLNLIMTSYVVVHYPIFESRML